MTQLIDILSVALLLTPIGGIVATIFLWRVYLSDTARPRSWVLFLLAAGSTIVSAAGVSISVVAMIRLSGVSIGFIGGVVLAVTLLILEWVPIWYALTIYKQRRTGSVSDAHFHDSHETSGHINEEASSDTV